MFKIGPIVNGNVYEVVKGNLYMQAAKLTF